MKLLFSKLTNGWLAPYVFVAITMVIAALAIGWFYQLFVAVESLIETSAAQLHHQIIYKP